MTIVQRNNHLVDLDGYDSLAAQRELHRVAAAPAVRVDDHIVLRAVRRNLGSHLFLKWRYHEGSCRNDCTRRSDAKPALLVHLNPFIVAGPQLFPQLPVALPSGAEGGSRLTFVHVARPKLKKLPENLFNT